MKIAILGYGNLAKGVESAVRQNKDMELKYVFTRRDPAGVKVNTDGVIVKSVDEILNYKQDIDVLLICSHTYMWRTDEYLYTFMGDE